MNRPVLMLSAWRADLSLNWVMRPRSPLGQKVNIHLASATVAFDATQVVASSVVGGFGAFDVSVTAPATWPNGAAVSDATLTWIASTPDGGIKATAEFSVTQ